jgi:hypothetical protein
MISTPWVKNCGPQNDKILDNVVWYDRFSQLSCFGLVAYREAEGFSNSLESGLFMPPAPFSLRTEGSFSLTTADRSSLTAFFSLSSNHWNSLQSYDFVFSTNDSYRHSSWIKVNDGMEFDIAFNVKYKW